MYDKVQEALYGCGSRAMRVRSTVKSRSGRCRREGVKVLQALPAARLHHPGHGRQRQLRPHLQRRLLGAAGNRPVFDSDDFYRPSPYPRRRPSDEYVRRRRRQHRISPSTRRPAVATCSVTRTVVSIRSSRRRATKTRADVHAGSRLQLPQFPFWGFPQHEGRRRITAMPS